LLAAWHPAGASTSGPAPSGAAVDLEPGTWTRIKIAVSGASAASSGLETIRRQVEPWQREASENLAGGRVAPALDAFQQAGRLHAADTSAAARAELAAAATAAAWVPAWHAARVDPMSALRRE
jgi:hypothetical protein